MDRLQAGDRLGHLKLVGFGRGVEPATAKNPLVGFARHVRDQQFTPDLATANAHDDVEEVSGQLDSGASVALNGAAQ